MNSLARFTNSSLGRKYLVAITGIVGIGFVIGHLAGNLLVFAGPEALNSYAEGLRTFPALLWAARIGLIVAVVLHIYFTIQLNLENKRARPVPYASRRNFQKASWASRHMALTGVLFAAYLVFHLAHFTWRVTSEEVAQWGHYDVYQMVVTSFQDPLVALTYIVAVVLLGIHLWHGTSSVTQSLGLNHPKYNKFLRLLGPASGIILTLGYASIPIAIWLGLVS